MLQQAQDCCRVQLAQSSVLEVGQGQELLKQLACQRLLDRSAGTEIVPALEVPAVPVQNPEAVETMVSWTCAVTPSLPRKHA